MIRSKSRIGSAFACAVAVLTLFSATAQAGSGGGGGNSLDGAVFQTCGNWVLKLRDFGKYKLSDYNAYVPPIYQSGPAPVTQLFLFGSTGNPNFGPGEFQMFVNYPDQLGDPIPGFGLLVRGTYNQRGKKIKFFPNAAGLVNMATMYSELGENILFGDPDRQLVIDIPFAQVTNPGKLRFKGRLKKGGDRLKVKFKARMLYDIQYEIGSEFPDLFNAQGVFKLRGDTNRCPPTPN